MLKHLLLSKKLSIALLVLFILLGTTGFIIHNTDNSLHSIELYLAWFFIPALIMPIVIGFQGKIHNDFLRCLFHAYLFVFSLYLLNTTILFVQSFASIGGCFVVAMMAPAYISKFLPYEDYIFSILIYTMPIICILLIGLLLFIFRKNKNKKIRVTGQICTFLLFAVYYIVCMWYLSHNFFIGIPMGAN